MRLYEAKCFWHFDHRFATFSGGDYEEVSESQKRDPRFAIKVRYSIQRSKIPEKFRQRLSPWHLSFRKISNATNARTLVVSITPQSGLLDSGNNIYILSATNAACLLGSLNSFGVDYVARQKMGGPNMTVGIISQLPSIPPSAYDQPRLWIGKPGDLRNWLLPRALELTYTAWDLEPFAKDCGWFGPPFRWDEERRFLLRASWTPPSSTSTCLPRRVVTGAGRRARRRKTWRGSKPASRPRATPWPTSWTPSQL